MKLKARLYAFFTHLTLSGLIAAMSVAMVFGLWYPMPLNRATGVTDIYLLLLIVDIVVGPVITFVVFQPKKPGLKMDLTIIGALQLIALSYGLFTVFEGRPVFIVFNQDRFDLVRPVDINLPSAKKAKQEGNKVAEVSWFHPNWIGAEASKDPRRNQEILFSSIAGGADWPQLPELYVPLQQVKPQMLKKARDFQELRNFIKRDRLSETLLDDIDASNTKWLPLRALAKNMVVLVDAKSAAIIKIIDISPWPQ